MSRATSRDGERVDARALQLDGQIEPENPTDDRDLTLPKCGVGH
jgi:hypothetical protein